jgi:hypothetical protein
VEFWKKEAYIIAEKVTGGNPIYRDLVSHVYILVCDIDIPSKDLPRLFARYAYNQYNWRDSQFNKQYRLNDPLPELDNREEDQEYHETEMQLFLDSYMEKSPDDDQELFTKEITKMHLMGMTYREIRNETGISLDTIHLAIKQFKNDLLITYHYSNRDCESSPELQSTGLQTI